MCTNPLPEFWQPQQLTPYLRIGITRLFSIMPYGDQWRNHRRIFQQHFSAKHLPRDQEKELEFVRKGLLPNLLATPQDFAEHIRR